MMPKEPAQSREHLEILVSERTAELKKTNERLQKEIHEREKIEEQLRKQQETLEKTIEERTEALTAAIKNSQLLNDALRNLLADSSKANKNLENTTRELTAANEDLEAFTYSVSHDLRSPLRAIEGFSRILQETAEDNLSEQSLHYIENIRSGAQKMDRLIKDLLDLSHLGRQSLNKVLSDPTKIIDKVVDEQKALFSNKVIDITVKEHSPVSIDRALMKQVYTNLISNAIKFSQYQDKLEIELGELSDIQSLTAPFELRNEHVFYIRDNGAGFDMNYSDKLFSVFQRLHDDEKFKGSGVGLAIVKTIIQRHGGQVWATSEVGKGATFFFTLPKQEIAGKNN